ncbi:MAG: addiction module antidote protein, HigA family [Gammaproteobacteria bacterium]|nr:MAG: addiction module antidote protein, HigA family [Gammaproteobacteria bacterium]
MIHEPLHPGEIIKELCINATGLTVTQVAKKLGVDRTTFSRLINGHAGISPEMAVRLSIALETPAAMWMNLQRDFDLYKAEKRRKKLRVEKITQAAA